MSYTDPKIFVADPMAFQQSFNEQFGKFLEIQRKADEKAEKGLNDFTSGLYSSEAYTSADAEMRNVLSSYFKDKQQEYMSAKNDSEKNKLMADAMAEAGQFVNSYKLSNEARFNALSTSYLGKPIEELHFADPEEPIVPTYQNGKFGISFKSDNGKQVFLNKEDLYKSKPPYANEILETTQKRLQQSIDQFSKNNDGFDEEELNANREAEVNRFISKLNKDEIVSLMSTYQLSGPEELKAEISSQFGDSRAYANLAKKQREIDYQIDAEQRKNKAEKPKQKQLGLDDQQREVALSNIVSLTDSKRDPETKKITETSPYFEIRMKGPSDVVPTKYRFRRLDGKYYFEKPGMGNPEEISKEEVYELFGYGEQYKEQQQKIVESNITKAKEGVAARYGIQPVVFDGSN
jgi:hypothetical protein